MSSVCEVDRAPRISESECSEKSERMEFRVGIMVPSCTICSCELCY
jgi:hypothetical protein